MYAYLVRRTPVTTPLLDESAYILCYSPSNFEFVDGPTGVAWTGLQRVEYVVTRNIVDFILWRSFFGHVEEIAPTSRC